jgi:hypothetical protein
MQNINQAETIPGLKTEKGCPETSRQDAQCDYRKRFEVHDLPEERRTFVPS